MLAAVSSHALSLSHISPLRYSTENDQIADHIILAFIAFTKKLDTTQLISHIPLVRKVRKDRFVSGERRLVSVHRSTESHSWKEAAQVFRSSSISQSSRFIPQRGSYAGLDRMIVNGKEREGYCRWRRCERNRC